MRGRVVRVPTCEILLAELVDGEVDCVGRAGAEAHCADSTVETTRAFEFENRAQGLPDSDGINREGAAEDLHPGLEGVDREHGHVLDRAGGGTGDHVLPELKAVVGGGYIGCRYFGVEIGFLGLRERPKSWGGIGGHCGGGGT